MYEIFIQDEWSDIYLLGFYSTLDDSIEDVNAFISVYREGKYKIKPGMLNALTTPAGNGFDASLADLFNLWEDPKDQEDLDEFGMVMIRGFDIDLPQDISDAIIKLGK